MTSGTTDHVHVAHLVDLLGDADPGVRLRSAVDLGEGRHEDAAAAIVERFGLEHDFAVREMLTWAALRLRDAALPHLDEALDSARWLARLQAVHTLSKLGNPDAAARLVPLIDDPVDAVAARAYGAAAQAGDPRVVPALVAQLSRGNSDHRNSLTVALGVFGTWAAPALAGALRESDRTDVRRHAADTLGHLGSPGADQATPALADALRDPDEGVRIAALNALGQLTLPSACEVVDRAADSSEPRLRHLAARLAERRPSDIAIALAARARPGPEVAGGTGHGARAGSTVADAGLAPFPHGRAGPWPVPNLALVSCEGGPFAAELAPILALQVEVCRPQYLSRDDVPAQVVARVRSEAAAQARANGRSESMADRIAAGRVEQFIHETVLLEQVSVANPGAIVKDLLFGREVRITWFAGLDIDSDRW